MICKPLTSSSLALSAAACLLLSSPDAAARGLSKDLNEQELAQYLTDGSEKARIEACKRLGKRRSPSAVPAVGKAAQSDASARVRDYCVSALEDIGSVDAAPFLREIVVSDGDDKVRVSALHVLGRLDVEKNVLPIALKLLESPEASLNVRRKGANVVGTGKWSAATPNLVKIVKSGEPVELREECLRSLVLIGTDEAYAVIHETLLKDPSVDMRRTASWVLERHPRASSLEPLCKALEDSDVKIAKNAVDALVRLGNRNAVPALRAAAAKHGDKLARVMNKAADRLE